MSDLLKNIISLPSVSQLLRDNNIIANKKLGQNFLFDLNICDKIVKHSAPIKGNIIIEVGPGPGALSRSILAAEPKLLIAIEKDRKFIELLQNYLQPIAKDKLKLLNEDALKFDWLQFDEKVKIIANLPYNISTVLLVRWLENINKFSSLTLMFQKEVADRIIAECNKPGYGKLAILTNMVCDTQIIMQLSPQAFFPPPKVNSTVIKLTPKKNPYIAVNKILFNQILQTSFNHRRKTIKSSLKSCFKDIDIILQEAEIAPNSRPQELSIEKFLLLTKIAHERQ